MSELRVLLTILAALVAWATYTVEGVPVAKHALGALEGVAESAPPPRFDSKGRPALRACFTLTDAADRWAEEEDCRSWGGYDLVFRELCEQDSGCFEKSILFEQRCLDQPASCYRFLPARPALT
jgi:hypothetical protein